MKLFDYQEAFIENIRNAFRRNKRVVGCAITGFGKTVVACEIAIRAASLGRRVVLLVHRDEILKQFFKTFRRLGITPSIISREFHQWGQIVIAMVETFSNRVRNGRIDPDDIGLLINDEAHYGSYPKVLNKVDCHILGLTATPKMVGTQGELKDYYDDIVLGPSVRDLINLGRLVEGVTYSISHDFSHVKKQGKEYQDNALLEEFKKAKLYDGAVQKYMEICPDRKAICYCVNIKHGLDTAVQFRDAGVKKVYCIDSKDSFQLINGNFNPCDRRTLFRNFEQDDHAVLVNVGIATTGYDCPDVSCIIENFATMSITKHHQTIGRGARSHPGKKNFIIIDMGRNYLRHKYYGEHVDWAYIFRNPGEHEKRAKTEKRRDVRECNECGMVIKMQTKVCPYCGEIYSDKEIENAILQGATLKEIKNYRLQNLPVNLRKDVHRMTYPELVEFGRHMGYKPSWANIIYNKRRRR